MTYRPKLIGPFSQILPLSGMPLKGPLCDSNIEIIQNGGVLVEEDIILKCGDFDLLYQENKGLAIVEEVSGFHVLIPGLIDAHTHMCFAGSRARDYSLKVAGGSYQDILKSGGGIHETVQKTREATESSLKNDLLTRCSRHLREGVTTAEVKSGYGLTVDSELKMLRVIKNVDECHAMDLLPTCLAAHVKPKEFDSESDYLDFLVRELLPKVQEQKLTNRLDIFVENGAFTPDTARPFLKQVKKMGFMITIHADQFSTGGSALAVAFKACSADHLEASGDADIRMLAQSDVVAIALPGASMGLGMQFAPARKILDHGGCLAIASDWNPGSAPMGDLLLQTAVLGAYQKLSTAETLAGITVRAAHALRMDDRGHIAPGKIADMVAFPTHDYREILYNQGKLKPFHVWKKGVDISQNQQKTKA